jgi:hypothetical protein
VAFLKDRAHANRELATAGGALVKAVTLQALGVLFGRLRADASQLVMPVHGAAIGANRTLGPQDFLYMLESGGFVMEVWAGQQGHGSNSLSPMYEIPLGLSSV